MNGSKVVMRGCGSVVVQVQCKRQGRITISGNCGTATQVQTPLSSSHFDHLVTTVHLSATLNKTIIVDLAHHERIQKTGYGLSIDSCLDYLVVDSEIAESSTEVEPGRLGLRHQSCNPCQRRNRVLLESHSMGSGRESKPDRCSLSARLLGQIACQCHAYVADSASVVDQAGSRTIGHPPACNAMQASR